MKRVALTIGCCAILAAGFFGLSDRGGETTQPGATQADLGFMPFEAVRPSQPTRSISVPVPSEELAQQYGTVCQTPQGSVCTVAPAPINSRCECQGSYGLIVQ